MGYKASLIALTILAAASPAAAVQPDTNMEGAGAPAAAPDARYCLRVEPETGSRIEMIRCETRWEWSELGVDIDREWAREGVRVIGPSGMTG
jgi:hypothetical protein